jgi:hypothetical protein
LTDDGTGRGVSRRVRLILRLVGITAILGMTIYLLWRDELPPEDADLRNYRRDVKDEDNGFRLVDLSEDDIAWPSDAEEDLLVNCISTTFDVKKAAEIARSNAWWIDKIDAALERREFQVDDEDMKVPRLLGWRRMAYVLTSRSRLHIEEGRPEEAYEDAMRVICLGSRFQRARGTLIEFLVGAAVQGVGNHRLVHMAIHGELPVQVLRRGMDELGPEIRRNGLADSLRAEYVYMSKMFDNAQVILDKSLPRFFFKPAQTKRLLAEKIRSLIEADSTAPPARKPLDLSDLTSSYWEVFLLRKAGSGALEESLPPFEKALKQADTDHVRLATTRVLLRSWRTAKRRALCPTRSRRSSPRISRGCRSILAQGRSSGTRRRR